jgi:hypothetical protein
MMQVRVLGSCVALGDFEVDKAVRLCTTDDAYPVWSAETPVVVTRGYPITYRCGQSVNPPHLPHSTQWYYPLPSAHSAHKCPRIHTPACQAAVSPAPRTSRKHTTVAAQFAFIRLGHVTHVG